ncbi:hypothetical protein [Nostoc sp.]|uniref:hypothetical protein n=1 Tax=Nostoc sp. TaxID=1180 RepID=UPI002FF824D0
MNKIRINRQDLYQSCLKSEENFEASEFKDGGIFFDGTRGYFEFAFSGNGGELSLSSRTELITQRHCERSEAIARAGIASLRSQ